MKHLFVSLIAIVLATSAPQTNDGHLVRYSALSGPMSMSVSHDITVLRDEPIHADRKFSYDLSMATTDDSITVTVESAKATFTAHDMTQRLPTRGLTGASFPLAIGDGGRQLNPVDPAEALVIDLGPATQPGYSIAQALQDTLPILPEQAVRVGTTWKTEQTIQSLAGWTWATGVMKGDHRVTSVEKRTGHTHVTVETRAEATLGPVEGGKDCDGTLKRSLQWTFDATNGQLVSLSLEQETDGTSTVPQGEIRIHQVTTVKLAPRS
jgi:hypothetical protein